MFHVKVMIVQCFLINSQSHLTYLRFTSSRQDFVDGFLRQTRSWGGRVLIGRLEFPTAGKAKAQSSLVVRQVKECPSRAIKGTRHTHLPPS
jgi:hypothetical protein